MRALSAGLAAIALLLSSCGEEAPARTIDEWDLFVDPATQEPSEGVVPYDIVAPLFSDYAAKHRFIRLPEGGVITVDADGRWQFPVGTVLVKTFAFPYDMRDLSLGERVIETRLLVLEEGGWEPFVYVWDEAVEQAVLAPAGRRVPVEFIDATGETVSFTYRVPSHTQCGNCHGGTGDIIPLGPRTGQLDRDHDYGAGPEDQIDHLVALGWLEARPGPSPAFADYGDPAGADLDARARSYIDANCAHCHREGGGADQSGLWLGVETEAGSVRLGICKPPVATGPRGSGGRAQVIHPGDPDDSIFVFRMESDEPGVKMPEEPTILVHREGAALIREWIAAMPPRDCSM